MIELSASPAATVVNVVGDLDLAERSEFAGVLAAVSTSGRLEVVVDLCGVAFMDSAGAAFLTDLAETTRRRGGTAVLRGAREQDLFVLQMCGGLGRFVVDDEHEDCSPRPPRRPWSSTRGEPEPERPAPRPGDGARE